jgi:hypothetical protein
MGETVAIIAIVVIAWMLYLLSAIPVSLPLWYFGRRRAGFIWWELSAFVLPFIVWLVSIALAKDKRLGNIVEALILGCSVPVAALVRVIVGRAVNRSLIAGSLIVLICVGAILLGTMYPKIEFQPFVK